jgi:hypothetical protein
MLDRFEAAQGLHRAESHAYTMYFDPLATILAVPAAFVPCGGARKAKSPPARNKRPGCNVLRDIGDETQWR